MISTDISIWIQAILVIMMLSWLFKESIITRVPEHIYLGALNAVTFIVGINALWGYIITIPSHPTYIIPIIVSLFLFVPIVGRATWLGRYPVAIMAGTGIGLVVSRMSYTNIAGQILPTIAIIGSTPFNTASNVLMAIIVICTMVMFIFTWEPKSRGASVTMGGIRTFAQYTFMVLCGVAYASYLVARITSLITAITTYIWLNWLGIGIT